MIQLFCHGSQATSTSDIILPEYNDCCITTYPIINPSVGDLYEKVFDQNRQNIVMESLLRHEQNLLHLDVSGDTVRENVFDC